MWVRKGCISPLPVTPHLLEGSEGSLCVLMMNDCHFATFVTTSGGVKVLRKVPHPSPQPPVTLTVHSSAFLPGWQQLHFSTCSAASWCLHCTAPSPPRSPKQRGDLHVSVWNAAMVLRIHPLWLFICGTTQEEKSGGLKVSGQWLPCFFF